MQPVFFSLAVKSACPPPKKDSLGRLYKQLITTYVYVLKSSDLWCLQSGGAPGCANVDTDASFFMSEEWIEDCEEESNRTTAVQNFQRKNCRYCKMCKCVNYRSLSSFYCCYPSCYGRWHVNLKLCDWQTGGRDAGSIFLTVLMFSFNDIVNISQHKYTKVSLITQQFDRFLLRPSALIISPSILRNTVFFVRFW